MMKTAVVTGAAGFLGYHLCEKLLKENYHVIAVDNMITGQAQNIKTLQNNYADGFLFIKADVTDPWISWKNDIPAVWLENTNFVFHFASVASPHLFEKYSLEIIDANSMGLRNAISFADEYKAKVVFASTSEIYGSAPEIAFTEDNWGNVNSFGERSCYDESKRFGETLIFSSNKKKSTQHGLVRIFNTYGPHMNSLDERVIQQFLKQALQNKDITIYGDGNQTRSFCYVDDLINAIYLYAKKNISVPVNIGQDEEITIHQLALLIKKLFNKDVRIIFTANRSDDPKKRKPDLTKALKLLSPWKPTTRLEEGLIKTNQYIKESTCY